jgi:hypothetical protein
MPVGDAPTTLRGSLSGGWRFGQYTGWWTDVLEYVPDLTWPTSVWTYARMRHDPTLQSVISAYMHPLLRASWSIDPRGASDAVAGQCADSLGIPLLGAETKDPGAQRQRGVKWVEHVRLAALTLVFGHMAFEPTYDLSTGVALLKALPERMPQTISNIQIDGDGVLRGISQSATPLGTDLSGTVTIAYDEDPARSELLWYVNNREGAAWQGQSIFRSCFGPWLIKQDIIRAHATGIRRFGAGTPVMEPVQGYTPTPGEVAEAQRLAQAVRVGETGGATTKGFTLHIKGVEGTLPDALPFLNYLDQQMARSALTSTLDLGNTPNGSRALGLAFLDVMAMAQQGFAEQIAATASRLCTAIATYNEGDAATAPAVVVGDVANSERVMADTVGQLISAGALVMDDELQAWVRRVLDLPQAKAPIMPVRAPGAAPGVPDTGAAATPPAVGAMGAGGGIAKLSAGTQPATRGGHRPVRASSLRRRA